MVMLQPVEGYLILESIGPRIRALRPLQFQEYSTLDSSTVLWRHLNEYCARTDGAPFYKGQSNPLQSNSEGGNCAPQLIFKSYDRPGRCALAPSLRVHFEDYGEEQTSSSY